ncbi:MAG TPA: tRNA (N6-isopentenyl adenosine(37)-C2)-methylthiotransferase MiaB [Eggerthellaceae bacterium]|nr:tRNA (N6-isopentenyl adenosine(37)-C2)-methylthiotransferase MiaB [Eggerthellaceae bacterium]
MARVRSMQGRPASYYIVTYGCQMNAHDSESLEGMLQEMGLRGAPDRTCADFVIFNTCCVRDNAERRALGNVTWLKELKKTNPDLRVAVCGCMIQEPGMADQILRTYPFIDLAFGTHNLYHFPTLFEQMVIRQRRVIEVVNDDLGSVPEELPIVRANPYQAYITIMYGCNNFCSYCIVPSVRGRERSREPGRILEEAEQLRREGVKEIMLLGQNVNSYGRDLYGSPRFADVLEAVADTGVERLRFATSHPKDLTDEVIAKFASLPNLMPALHLPAQSGSNAVLKAMNRRYTVEHYRALIDKLRDACPGISLSTDIIVGFPGETEQDFLDTRTLVDEVGYSQVFTFIYSKRAGTPAADMTDETPRQVILDRFERLRSSVERGAFEYNQSQQGKTIDVLFEGPSKKEPNIVTGRSPENITVHAPLAEGMSLNDVVGNILPVRVDEARTWYLRGTIGA